MKEYLDMLEHVIKNGVDKEDRTGTGTRSVFGYQLRLSLESDWEHIDLDQNGLNDSYRKGVKWPLLTTKKIHWKSVLGELAWFMQGRTDVDFLHSQGITIWDEWVKEDGTLGPVYGKQWRDFGGVDQLLGVHESLRDNPYSRRQIVSAWNPTELKDMALEPCHVFFQFNVRPEGNHKVLDLHMYQRSADIFLGVPFNIACYTALQYIFATCLGYEVGDYIHTFGDLHLYKNHYAQAVEQLNREPKNHLPTLVLKPIPEYNQLFIPSGIEDFEVIGYDSHPGIKAPVAV